MRKIEFRGKSISSNQWIYGYYWTNELENHFIRRTITSSGRFVIEDIEVIPETVGQFTGIYDKNNKPIYEDDIVKYTYIGEDGEENDYKPKEGIVNFKNNMWHINSKQLTMFVMRMFEFIVVGTKHDIRRNI